jgi:hypothetical protein
VSTGISNGTRECRNTSMVLQNFDPSEVLIQRIIKIILGKPLGMIFIVSI